MRHLGITLCLLASAFSARAESIDDRVAVLEKRVKALEEALSNQAAKPARIVDGTYIARRPNGETITAEFSNGRISASTGKETKTGTFEVLSDRVIATVDGKSEFLRIEGDELKGDKIVFTKSK